MTRFVLLSTLAAFVGLAGCTTATRPAPISHVVFFDLDDPADAAELVADCHELLPSIPGVVSCAAGQHLDTGRDMVDGDYDVGLYIGFDNEADYTVYIDHPQHVELVTRWEPRIESVLIRDFLDDRP
jgi:hypothetical protein